MLGHKEATCRFKEQGRKKTFKERAKHTAEDDESGSDSSNNDSNNDGSDSDKVNSSGADEPGSKHKLSRKSVSKALLCNTCVTHNTTTTSNDDDVRKSESKCRFPTPTSQHVEKCLATKVRTRHRHRQTSKPEAWVFDTAATSHMVGSKDSLIMDVKPECNKAVIMADGSKTSVKLSGSTQLPVEASGSTPFVLTNTLVVPKLEENLISISKLDKQGHKIVINKGKLEVSKKGQVKLTGTERRGLY